MSGRFGKRSDAIASVCVWAQDMLEINGVDGAVSPDYSTIEFEFNGWPLAIDIRGRAAK